jgi:hypothetical protein
MAEGMVVGIAAGLNVACLSQARQARENSGFLANHEGRRVASAAETNLAAVTHARRTSESGGF